MAESNLSERRTSEELQADAVELTTTCDVSARSCENARKLACDGVEFSIARICERCTVEKSFAQLLQVGTHMRLIRSFVGGLSEVCIGGATQCTDDLSIVRRTQQRGSDFHD